MRLLTCLTAFLLSTEQIIVLGDVLYGSCLSLARRFASVMFAE
jgi:hypothetical protein